MYTPTADMLSDLKMLLGISSTDTTKDLLLGLILKITGTKVLNEIHQTVLPGALEVIVVEMASDAYRLNLQATGDGSVGAIAGTVSSVSDNGQSVGYRDSSYQTVLNTVMTTLKNYAGQLARWRKPGW